MTSQIATQDIPVCDQGKLKILEGDFSLVEKVKALVHVYKDFTSAGLSMQPEKTRDRSNVRDLQHCIDIAWRSPELCSIRTEKFRSWGWEVRVEAYKISDIGGIDSTAERHFTQLKNVYAHHNEDSSFWTVKSEPLRSTHLLLWRKYDVVNQPLDETKDEKLGVVDRILFVNCENEENMLDVLDILVRGFFLAKPWSFMKYVDNVLVTRIDPEIDETEWGLDEKIIKDSCKRVLDVHAGTPDKFIPAFPSHALE